MKFKKGVVAVVPIIITIVVILGVVVIYAITSRGGESAVDSANADAVLLEAQKNMFSQGSYTSDASVIADISGIQSGGVEGSVFLDMDFKGVMDIKDINNPKYDLNMRLDNLTVKQGGSLSTTIGPIDIDIRQVGDMQFVRLNEGEIGFFDVSNLIGKWVSIDSESLASLSGLPPSSVTPSFSDSQADFIKVLKAEFGNAKLYDVVETLSDEEIKGVDSYHYKVALNKVGLVNFVDAFFTSVKSTKEYKAMSSAEKTRTETEIDNLLALMNKFDYDFLDIDLWISKRDLVATKTLVVIDVSELAKNISELDPSIPDEVLALKGNITITSVASDFGKKVNIVAPEGAQPFEEVIQQMFGGIGQFAE